MSELMLTLNPKQILRRIEPPQSKFIAVRFNTSTGKTLLDRNTISNSVEETKALSELPHQHRCVRIIELRTEVIRHYDTPTGSTTMVEIESAE